MSVSVRVSNLTKIYSQYHGPRALLGGLILGRPPQSVLEALKDVSFEVEEGEAFGLVGDNGAGKSTLLKVLTGTAVPSSGWIQVQGSVAALLELGVGFHPDFTGRENIYFSGAAMGLGREEVHSREDHIVGFSELGDFIDQPVKTYSSGMYVRLGFSVATGFDFSVLIIDEALAVGDQRFQKKCTDRILRFRREGKTILFCSHNLYQVRTLCRRALWLDRGEVRALGPAWEVVEAYNSFTRGGGVDNGERRTTRVRGSEVCWIEGAELRNDRGDPAEQFRSGETLALRIVGRFTEGFGGTPGLGLSMVRSDGVVIYTTSTSMDGAAIRRLGEGLYETVACFPNCPLLAGEYYFHLYATDQDYLQSYDIMEKVAPFRVTDGGPDLGLVRLEHEWR
jgi:lipopolysaccharide transport system ATP-binding protein